MILALSSLAQTGITLFLNPDLFLAPARAGYRPPLFLAEVVVFAVLAWTKSPRFHAVATVAVLVVTLVFVFVIQSPLPAATPQP